MNRIAWIISMLAALAFQTPSAIAAETILGQSKEQPFVQVIARGASDNAVLSLKIADSPVTLQSEGISSSAALHPDMPLKVESGALGNSPALCISFGINDGKGSVRSFAVIAVNDAAAWRAAKIWTADSAPRGELGFMREKQSIAFDAKSGIVRQARTVVSDGVVHKLDCGCATCGSLLTETSEEEKLVWNAAAGKLERTSYERRYTVQQGENVLTVARKALGDARLIARIFKLNPDVKQDGILQVGQKILVERQ